MNRRTKRWCFIIICVPIWKGLFFRWQDGIFSEAVTAPGTVAIEAKIKQKELEEYTAKKEWIYSNPNYDSDSGNDTRKICYAIPMYDKTPLRSSESDTLSGDELDYFLTQVKAYAKTQDLVALIGNDSEILYQEDKKNVLRDAIKDRGLDQKIFILFRRLSDLHYR